ncbi:hypothetical protein [Streptomyces sp. CNQ-509]|uniref:hypothetical protein n=1 Tax=Streptomyces sp. CNQ-509 TaxID=444103 RepID=UPI00069A27F0|nr:hypothetical protein [Streptomyces sp. CNQ-509]
MADRHAGDPLDPALQSAQDSTGRLRDMLVGPARYSGRRAPRWLRIQSAAFVFAATVVLVGLGAVSAYSPARPFRDGSAGIVFALTFAVSLLLIRAGRLFVVAVATVGIPVAVLTPQLAGHLVLEDRGVQLSAEVSAVAPAADLPGVSKPYCFVAQVPGSYAPVWIWRGCTSATTPGDEISVVYDPMGIVQPRGIEETPFSWQLVKYTGAVICFLAVSYTAVMRSYPFDPPPRHG